MPAIHSNTRLIVLSKGWVCERDGCNSKVIKI
jgi:hypothetical protein